MSKMLIVPDREKFNFTNCEYEKSIVISPFYYECFINTTLLKLKLYCRQKHVKIIAHGPPNFFPLYSLISDEAVLYNNPYEPEWYGGNTLNNVKMPPPKSLGRYVNIDEDENLIKTLDQKITIDEIVEEFKNLDICIRESTFNLYKKITTPENLIVSEIKPGCDRIKEMLTIQKVLNLEGIDHTFQRELVKQTGTNHYLGFQILASQLSNWMYVVAGGACCLFFLLPIKCLYMADRCLWDDSMEFLTKVRKPIPIMLRKNTSKGMDEDEQYIADHLSGKLEQVRNMAKQFPHEKPQIVYKYIDGT